jgi:predicted Zn-dependent protease
MPNIQATATGPSKPGTTKPDLARTAQSLKRAGQLDALHGLLAEARQSLPHLAWPLLETALLARDSKKWPLLLELTQALTMRFPHEQRGYLLRAQALRGLGQDDEIEAGLQAARAHFPHVAWPLAELAKHALARKSFGQAGELARQLRAAFPDEQAGYLVGAKVLLAGKMLADALLMVRDAAERFPAETWPLCERAWISLRAGDLDMAVEAAAMLRARDPADRNGYMVGLAALRRQARIAAHDALATEALKRFPDDAWAHLEPAQAAQMRRDLETALRLAADIRRRFPDERMGFSIGFECLRAAGRLEEAAILAGEWHAAHPADPRPLLERANLARMRADWPAAEAVLEDAMRQFPADPLFALHHANLPIARLHDSNRDYPAAFARFDTLRAAFPTYLPGYLDHIAARRQARDLQGAGQLAQLAAELFPTEAAPSLALAEIRRLMGRHAEATSLLRTAATHFPDDVQVLTALSAQLCAADRHAEAEQLMTRNAAHFGADPLYWREYAALATRQSRWAEAARRWSQAAAQFPADAKMAKGLFEARMALLEQDEPTAQPPAILPPDAPLADIAACFESLGGTGQGCEFGFVQRHAGIEPLGLLRWSAILPEDLLAALEAGFAGVGTEAQTQLSQFELEGHSEYKVTDSRFHLTMHSFIRVEDVPWGNMRQQSCRRLGFLARKLIEDLRAGQKIFVYKIAERTLDLPELLRLRAAIGAYGGGALLYVRLADATHPPGSVESPAPGLAIGAVSHYSMAASGEPRAPAYADWARICRSAYTILKQPS